MGGLHRIHRAPAAAHTWHNSRESGVSLSILIVDDEPDVAELFRQRFRREVRQGLYVLHFAGSGEEALEKLDTGIRPELIVILSDINMPGMDGLALLREIKTRWADLPVMMVTAYGDDERRRRADQYGALEFITKPVDFDLLKEQLRQLPSGAASANSTASAPRPSRPAPIPRAISRRTSSRCWPTATSPWARCGARWWRCCSSISSASPAWPSTCLPRRS